MSLPPGAIFTAGCVSVQQLQKYFTVRLSKDIIFIHATYSCPYSYNRSSGSNAGHIMVVSAQYQKHDLNIELHYSINIPMF